MGITTGVSAGEIQVNKCVGITKKGEICGKKSKYINKKEFYCKTHCPKDKNIKEIKKRKNKKNRNPFEYAIRIKEELDKRPELINVDIVLIENQPALVNPIMKTVQMILFSYFSFKHSKETPFIVKNRNAKRKEKLPFLDPDWENSQYKKDYEERISNIKSKYTKRKLLCYYYSLLCLESSPEMKEFLFNHSKKDDLTDSFLMCVDWFQRK